MNIRPEKTLLVTAEKNVSSIFSKNAIAFELVDFGIYLVNSIRFEV